jgi:coenzyme F420 hydrogenase subunit beta
VADVGGDKLAMEENDAGFLVPVCKDGFDGEVPNLRAYCPGITISLKQPLRTAQEKFYGPFSQIQVAWARDGAIRFKGSSGGVLTAILCALLEKGKVDGVLQAGASESDPTRTEARFSTTREEIISNAGSRYAPSSLLENFRRILGHHNRIAIVGKPCDIAGVKQFLDVYPEYTDKVYCTLSFMCMGLPSQNATRRLLSRLGVEHPDRVKSLTYRGNGWPGEAAVLTDEGLKHTCSYNESWGRILGRDVPFRCKICPDGWGSFADLSAGDAWYSDGKEPLFKDRPGRSFLFTRTEHGAAVLSDVAESIEFGKYDIAELPVIQKSQYARKERLGASYLVLQLLGNRMLHFRGVGMWSRVLKTPPWRTVRMILGFLKRMPRS